MKYTPKWLRHLLQTDYVDRKLDLGNQWVYVYADGSKRYPHKTRAAKLQNMALWVLCTLICAAVLAVPTVLIGLKIAALYKYVMTP